MVDYDRIEKAHLQVMNDKNKYANITLEMY